MSQGTYTITKAAEDRTYQNQHGSLVVWKVRLENATTEKTDGVFELHKKPGNEPKPGDTIEVDRFQEGESPNGTPYVRIFLAKQQGGSTTSTGGRPSQSSDERGESIERQVAAKVAGEIVAGHPSPHGPVGDVANFEGLFDAIIAKIQGKPGAAVQTAQNGGGEVPADMTGLDDPAVRSELGVAAPTLDEPPF